MSRDSEKRITVIIPSWNRAELLRNCLDSLRAQRVACRVLVIDNGSTDSTPSLMSGCFADVGYVRLAGNEGFARAVNRGIAAAETEYLALLNNDTEVDPGWIEAGLRVLDTNPDCGIVASRMLNYWHRDQLDSAGDCYSRSGLPLKRGNGLPADSFTELERVIAASAGAAFYRREVFDAIGPLDEDYYMYLEDVDLSLRAALAGFVCLYAPDAVVYHMEAASDPERQATDSGVATDPFVFYSDARVYWITRNRWLLMLTYQPWRHFPWLAYGWVRSLLFHLLKAGHLGSFLRGLGSGIRATPRALAKRRGLRAKTRVRPEELWRLMRKC